MKFFIITFIGAFLAVEADQTFAAAPNITATRKDNWETIRKDKDLMIEQPKFAKDMGPDGIFNVCATDDEFRSIRPVETCLDYKIIKTAPESTEFGMYPDFYCQQEAEGVVIVSRMSTEQVCEESVSQETEDKNATCLESTQEGLMPTNVSLHVMKKRGSIKGEHVFNKNYQIPECEM